MQMGPACATCLPLQRLARPFRGESHCRSSLSADKACGQRRQRRLITEVTRTDGAGPAGETRKSPIAYAVTGKGFAGLRVPARKAPNSPPPRGSAGRGSPEPGRCTAHTGVASPAGPVGDRRAACTPENAPGGTAETGAPAHGALGATRGHSYRRAPGRDTQGPTSARSHPRPPGHRAVPQGPRDARSPHKSLAYTVYNPRNTLRPASAPATRRHDTPQRPGGQGASRAVTPGRGGARGGWNMAAPSAPRPPRPRKEPQPLVIPRSAAEEQRLRLERLMRNPVRAPGGPAGRGRPRVSPPPAPGP